jgi:hypothetical protein
MQLGHRHDLIQQRALIRAKGELAIAFPLADGILPKAEGRHGHLLGRAFGNRDF